MKWCRGVTRYFSAIVAIAEGYENEMNIRVYICMLYMSVWHLCMKFLLFELRSRRITTYIMIIFE